MLALFSFLPYLQVRVLGPWLQSCFACAPWFLCPALRDCALPRRPHLGWLLFCAFPLEAECGWRKHCHLKFMPTNLKYLGHRCLTILKYFLSPFTLLETDQSTSFLFLVKNLIHSPSSLYSADDPTLYLIYNLSPQSRMQAVQGQAFFLFLLLYSQSYAEQFLAHWCSINSW